MPGESPILGPPRSSGVGCGKLAGRQRTCGLALGRPPHSPTSNTMKGCLMMVHQCLRGRHRARGVPLRQRDLLHSPPAPPLPRPPRSRIPCWPRRGRPRGSVCQCAPWPAPRSMTEGQLRNYGSGNQSSPWRLCSCSSRGNSTLNSLTVSSFVQASRGVEGDQTHLEDAPSPSGFRVILRPAADQLPQVSHEPRLRGVIEWAAVHLDNRRSANGRVSLRRGAEMDIGWGGIVSAAGPPWSRPPRTSTADGVTVVG